MAKKPEDEIIKDEIPMTKLEHNNAVWVSVKELENKIKELKETLFPAELPKQVSLNDCNILARKAKTVSVKVDPKKLSAERVA